jgi:NitT/TauT family transport system permease protein
MSAPAEIAKPNEPPIRRRVQSDRWIAWVTTPLLVLALLLGWDIYVRASGITAFILPAPSDVWDAYVAEVSKVSLWRHTAFTLYETIVGFFWAVLIGVGLGVLIGRLRWLETTLNPFVVATQVVPKVALVPLFVVWFGFGPTSKVLLSAALAFFPILTNTVLGVKSVDLGHRDVMLALNALRWKTFIRLELPSALPYVLTGMEVGVVLAIIGAVVGEYLGGNNGLGYLLIAKMNGYETDALFAVIIHLTLVGFAFYWLMGVGRRLLIPWHESVLIERAE